MALFECVQRRATTVITGLEHLIQDKLSLEKKRLRGDLTAPSVPKGGYKKTRGGLFTKDKGEWP